jgi:hypothetical protein
MGEENGKHKIAIFGNYIRILISIRHVSYLLNCAWERNMVKDKYVSFAVFEFPNSILILHVSCILYREKYTNKFSFVPKFIFFIHRSLGIKVWTLANC